MNIRERPDQPVRVKITVMVKGAVVFSRAYDEDSAKEGGKLHDFFSSVKVKINLPYLRFMKSLRNTVILKKFEFLRQFSKALKKLDHVLLWTLSTNTGL